MNEDKFNTEDYPSRKVERATRKILAFIDGKPSVIESGLEHRTRNFLTSMFVYDRVGHCVYSQTVDLPKECEMTKEVKTLQRDKNGLPTLIRQNQLGENLTQGLARILTEHVTGEPDKELKVLAQQQIALEWDDNKRLKSVTTFQLAEYTGDKEIWVPESVETFEYDRKGRLTKQIIEEYSEDGHYINYYFTYRHEQVAGHNRVIESWYTNDNYGKDKTKNALNLYAVRAAIYDPDTRERILFIGYSNVEITPKIPIMRDAKPVYVIKPEYGERLILKIDDLRKIFEENDVRAARLISDGLVPQTLDVPTTVNLSNYG